MLSVDPVEWAGVLRDVMVQDQGRLARIDRYSRGVFDDPYMPSDTVGPEYRGLLRRSMAEWCNLPVDAAVQAMAVDAFRSGAEASGTLADSGVVLPEWAMWQRSNLDAKQAQVYRAAFTFGQEYVVSFLGDDGRSYAKGLSPLNTAVWFEDPGWDDNPVAVLHRGPRVAGPDGKVKGRYWDLWDRTNCYRLFEKDGKFRVESQAPHGGAGHCPVTRFPVALDQEGRVCGFIEPIIPLQDRLNQTMFDLLVAQTYTSFQVLAITGMQPEQQLDAEGRPLFDAAGNPVMRKLQRNPSRMMVAESADTKFQTLPGGSLSGFIDSLDMSIRHFSSLTQTPPHFLLGQIANLSAEALQAAEQSFARKISEHQRVFGEAWERVLRIGMILEGHPDYVQAGARAGESEVAERGEVVWRDFGAKQIAASADGLGKLAQQLQIPARGLWARVPGVTDGELRQWEALAEQDNDKAAMLEYLDGWGSPAPAPVDEGVDAGLGSIDADNSGGEV